MQSIRVQLVPGYMRLDKTKGMMVPSYPPSFPKREDAPLAPIVSLAEALTDAFEPDAPNYRWYRDGRCYIMQCEPYQPNPRKMQGPRLAGEAWEVTPIVMQLLLTDVDASSKKEPGFDIGAWWLAQTQVGGIPAFLEAHPGAFIACSRGGLRIYQVLDEPFVIDSAERAKEWKQRYIAWTRQLARFPWVDCAHGGADQLVDWTRLQRIPHDTRDGVVQELPTIGDAQNVGTVKLPAPAPNPKPRTALYPYRGPVVQARVRRFVLERVAAILPKQGDGVHEAAFSLGGLLSASHWSVDDCAQFVATCFEFAGIVREDIARTAALSVETARAGGRAYAWRRFVDVCQGDLATINLACGTMRTHIPGLSRDAQWHNATGVSYD